MPQPPEFAQGGGTGQEQQLARLREQAAAIEEQLKMLRSRAAAVQSELSRGVASIDAQRCTLCGACEAVCPTGAITLAETARVDTAKCTGCGACVEACPSSAIVLN